MDHLPRRRFEPVPMRNVTIEDRFWAPKLKINREKTLPHEYHQCKETGRIDAFRLDWKPGKGPVPHIFWDSDVAKWVEAASYAIAMQPDPGLQPMLDEVVSLIVSAQQPDGYLNCHFTVVEPEKRWSNLRDCHELYCAGHLIEAAVAHHAATGRRDLLDAACRYADYIASVFGTEPGKKRGYCGHEEIELALVKLYRATGKESYLCLAKYFIDERGTKPCYFEEEARARGEDPARFWGGSYEVFQAHKPVREQTEVVGHAVRAMYLYAAMADLAGELGDQSLADALDRLWESAHLRRMYIHGGVGSTGAHEGFTSDYDLPNETAYAETCAAIGLIFWNHRMLQLDCDSRYADAMERAFYNGALSGVSLDGTKFFYENRLASRGDFRRQPWFGCACCPPNIARLLASLGQYVCMTSEDEIAVHLYVQGAAEVQLGGRRVLLRQESNYPWDGRIAFTLEMDRPTTFGLRLRLPGWARGAHLEINGDPVELSGLVERGYVRLKREWKSGDRIRLDLPMPVERISAHPAVRYDAGLIALQRGPILYCLEEADNPVALHRILLPKEAKMEARYEKDTLGGVVILHADALIEEDADWTGVLYRAQPPKTRPFRLTAIPYYAWDNRTPGQMAVWIRG